MPALCVRRDEHGQRERAAHAHLYGHKEKVFSLAAALVTADQQRTLYLAAQFVAHDDTLDAIDLLPVLKEDQGGDTIDSVLVGKFSIAIHVDSGKGHAPLVFLTDGGKFWLKNLARSAPVRGEIDDHHSRVLQHLFCEILFACCDIAACRICHNILFTICLSVPHTFD